MKKLVCVVIVLLLIGLMTTHSMKYESFEASATNGTTMSAPVEPPPLDAQPMPTTEPERIQALIDLQRNVQQLLYPPSDVQYYVIEKDRGMAPSVVEEGEYYNQLYQYQY